MFRPGATIQSLSCVTLKKMTTSAVSTERQQSDQQHHRALTYSGACVALNVEGEEEEEEKEEEGEIENKSHHN